MLWNVGNNLRPRHEIKRKKIASAINFPDPIHIYLWVCLEPWTTMYQIYKVLFQCFYPLSIWENDAKMCMIFCFVLNKHPCSICFPCSPTSTKFIYTTRIMLHWKMNCEASTISYLKSYLHLINHGYQKCMFVDPLTDYINPSNCVHYWKAVVLSTLNKWSRPLYTCVLIVFAWESSPNHTRIKPRCLMEKNTK